MKSCRRRTKVLPFACVYASLVHLFAAVLGIPRVRYFGREPYASVMVMDLLGPSLEDLFNFCGRKFTLKTVLMLADQMVSRLEHVHSRALLHRDVKPDNFLIGSTSHHQHNPHNYTLYCRHPQEGQHRSHHRLWPRKTLRGRAHQATHSLQRRKFAHRHRALRFHQHAPWHRSVLLTCCCSCLFLLLLFTVFHCICRCSTIAA